MCVRTPKQFHCGCSWIDWTFCDEYLKQPTRKVVEVNGEKQPDCKTIETGPFLNLLHCCTLTCCVKDVTRLQTEVREWEHLAVLPVGWRPSSSDAIPKHASQLGQAQKTSLTAAWRHLNLCSVMIIPGHKDSLGIINAARRVLDIPPHIDIPPRTHAEHVFREFSYDIREARNRALRVLGPPPTQFDQTLQQTAGTCNGLGKMLWKLLHLGAKIEGQSQTPKPAQPPKLSSFQRKQIDTLQDEQRLTQEDQTILNSAFSARLVPRSPSDYAIKWNKNENIGGPHSQKAYHQSKGQSVMPQASSNPR
jgi:hypothetical protein